MKHFRDFHEISLAIRGSAQNAREAFITSVCSPCSARFGLFPFLAAERKNEAQREAHRAVLREQERAQCGRRNVVRAARALPGPHRPPRGGERAVDDGPRQALRADGRPRRADSGRWGASSPRWSRRLWSRRFWSSLRGGNVNLLKHIIQILSRHESFGKTASAYLSV